MPDYKQCTYPVVLHVSYREPDWPASVRPSPCNFLARGRSCCMEKEVRGGGCPSLGIHTGATFLRLDCDSPGREPEGAGVSNAGTAGAEMHARVCLLSLTYRSGGFRRCTLASQQRQGSSQDQIPAVYCT